MLGRLPEQDEGRVGLTPSECGAVVATGKCRSRWWPRPEATEYRCGSGDVSPHGADVGKRWFTNRVPRPRSHSDDELLTKIESALSARPARGQWTLAEVGADVGVHAATLVKRFGSRKGLLLALSRRWIQAMPVTAQTADPVRELLTWADNTFSQAADREAALAGMDFLMRDLADDELAGCLQEGWQRQAGYVSDLLRKAALQNAPAADRAGELIVDALNGALLRGSTHPDPRTAPSPRTIITTLLETWT